MTVASRIGLMHEGRLAQVATPAEIYEIPASRFAADFIGDVNLIEGKAGKTSTRQGEAVTSFTTNHARGSFSARSQDPVEAGTLCWLAVRPEKIAITTTKPKARTNMLSGRVHDIGYLGNLTTYHVQLEDGTIIKAQEANRQRIANRTITWEDPVWLHWTPGAGILLTK